MRPIQRAGRGADQSVENVLLYKVWKNRLNTCGAAGDGGHYSLNHGRISTVQTLGTVMTGSLQCR